MSEAVRTYERAQRAIEAERFDEALGLAKRLHELRYTGGFEIEARALVGKGEIDAAITVAERGANRFSQVTFLWSFLGELYSNAGRYEEARQAFLSFRHHGGDPGIAAYNMAVVEGRDGRPEESLRWAETAVEPVEGALGHLRGRALLNLGRIEEAAEAGHRGMRAIALAHLGRHEEARAIADTLLRDDHADPEAAEAILWTRPPSSPAARWWIFATLTPGPDSDVPPNFDWSGAYHVDADTVEEAIGHVRDVEPSAIAATISQSMRMETPPGDRAGVVWVHPPNILSPSRSSGWRGRVPLRWRILWLALVTRLRGGTVRKVTPEP